MTINQTMLLLYDVARGHIAVIQDKSVDSFPIRTCFSYVASFSCALAKT